LYHAWQDNIREIAATRQETHLDLTQVGGSDATSEEKRICVMRRAPLPQI
jgi:hypothetical protein